MMIDLKKDLSIVLPMLTHICRTNHEVSLNWFLNKAKNCVKKKKIQLMQ